MRNSKLYLILDAEVQPYEKLYEIAKQSVVRGVDIVQLRDKKGSARSILKFSKEILGMLRKRVPFIVNDRLDLAMSVGASGVHLGQEDIPVSQARKIVGSKMLIGASCQNLEQAMNAEREGADYIGFGSVFKTLTKPDRKPMDLSLLAAVCKKINVPVFAIGGISTNNIAQLRTIGVQRVAVCRGILNAIDVGQVTREFKKALTY